MTISSGDRDRALERCVETIVLEDFRAPLETRWRRSGDNVIETFCKEHRLEQVTIAGAPALSWSFVASRHGAAIALKANLWLPRPFSRLVLRGGFEGDTSLQYLWSVADVAGRVSTSQPANVHQGGGQAWVLDLASLPGDAEFRLPLRALRLQLFSPPIGRAFRWWLQSVTAETWTAPGPSMEVEGAPRSVSPGDRITPFEGCPPGAEMVLLSGKGVLLTRGPGDRSLRVPLCSPIGAASIQLWHRARLIGERPVILEGGRPRRRARASLVRHRGRPAMAIDGVPVGALTYTTYHPREEHVDRFAGIGVSLLSFPTTCDHHVFDLAPPVMPDGREADFSFVDHVATRLLDRHPGAWLLPRVFLSSPIWWDREHPKALGVAEDPSGPEPLAMVHDDAEIEKRSASYASPIWRGWAAEAITRYVKHLRNSPYGHRVIGLCLASGGTEEWFHWHDERRPNLWGDLGPAAREGFRAWLRRLYRNDVERLRRAWRHDIEFDSAEVPSLERLQSATFGIWRDPSREQDAIDFLRYHQEQVADAITGVARAARRASEDDWLIGAFYGYVLTHTGHHRHLNGGHFALGKLLESGSVDFLCAPTAYGSRSLGDGYPFFMSPVESIGLRGGLWFNENDLRTHALEVPGDRDASIYRDGYGLTDDATQGESIQLRELAHCIGRGASQWWFDIYARSQFTDPALVASLEKLRAIHDAFFEDDRRSVSEVAVFVDERAPLYEDGFGRAFLESVPAARESIARLGAPCEEYLLSDLPLVPKKRLYVLLNAVAPSARERKAIHRLASTPGVTLLFLGPCGLMGDSGLDEGGPARLTGLPLRLEWEGHGEQVVTIEAASLRRSHGERWGHPGVPAPWVSIPLSVNAEVLGRCPDGSPGLVRRQVRGGATIWYAVAPAPPPRLWRDIAEAAGVHLYGESGDPLFVAPRMLTIHGWQAGRKRLCLREQAPLFEPLTGVEASARSRWHEVRLERGETRLFFLGSGSQWRGLERRARDRRQRLTEADRSGCPDSLD
ncbi:MAG: hypothetical protein RL885_24765 [Planctomycetota bacterium]